MVFQKEKKPKRPPPKHPRQKYETITPEDILAQGKSIEDPLAKALYFLCYLTGSRVGEACRFRLIDLARAEPSEPYSSWSIRMMIEKKHDKSIGHFRKASIPKPELAKCHETEMMAIVLDYLNRPEVKSKEFPFWAWGKKTPEQINDGQKDRPDSMGIYMSRKATMTAITTERGVHGWLTIQKTRKLFIHYLRHCRATHLYRYYGTDSLALKEYFGWSSVEMAARYAHPEPGQVFKPK